MFVYSSGSQQDYNEACQIENNLIEASKAYSIRYHQAVYVEVNAGRRLEAIHFCEEIEKAVNERGRKIELIFIILKQK